MAQPTHRLDEEMSGEDVLWRLFVEHYRKLVAYFVRHFGLSREDAQDLAQDTFICVFRAMPRYRGGNLLSLIYTTARHLALNKARGDRFRRRVEVENPLEDLAGALDTPKSFWTQQAPPTPEDGLVDRESDRENREQSRRLKAAILELPEIDRSCLLLRMAGLSYREIAATLRISEDAVKARLKRVKKTLRIKLGEDLEGLD